MAGNDFLGTYTPLANDIATQTGLDPSVVLGIIDTETGGGQHVSGNNIFGISPGGRVAGYPDVQTASQAFVDLINSRYKGVGSIGDPAGQAAALVRGGYNTVNPQYASIVAGKAANFGKQLGYQDSGGGNTQSGPSVYSTSSQPAPDYNTPSSSAAPPAAPQSAQQPDYNIAPKPAQPSQPPAPQPQPQPQQQGKPASLTEELEQQTGGGGGQQSSAAPPTQDGKPKSLTEELEHDIKNPTATTSTTSADQPQTGFWDKVGAGIGRGVRDVADPLGSLIARGAEAILPRSALQPAQVNPLSPDYQYGDPSIGQPPLSQPNLTADQLAAKNAADRQAYEQRYGGSDIANAARIGTQLAVTVPVTMGAGSVVGAGANLLARAAPVLAPAISATTGLLGGTLRGAGPVTNLLARGASTAAQGALIGGATGALTSGQSDQPIGQQALTGAITGAALGPTISAASTIIGAPFKALAARIFPGMASNQAVAKVAEAMTRDGLTPADVQTNLQRLGPEAGLVDAGGANVRLLGESVANRPGPGAEAAESFLEGRAAGQQSRINTAIRAATGSQADFYDALGDLTQQRSQAARPLYDAAFNSTIVSPQDAAALDRFVQDPIGQAGLQRGLRTIQLENIANNRTFNPADYGVTQDAGGNWLPSGSTNLRLFDAVKRGMDSIAEQYRNPTTGLMDFAKYDDNFGSGRAVDNLRNAYTAELRARFPDYADALNAWSGPSKAIDALNMGRRALANDPEVSARAIANLSDSEKEFFKAGVARALKDKVESAPDSADATKRIFGSQLIRDKIAAAFGDPNAFRQFQQTMENEAQFARTRNEVLKGSPTARRLAGAADIDVVTPALMAAHGHLVGAAANVGQQAMNALAQRSGDPVKNAIGRMLFSPQVGNDYINALQRAQNPLIGPALRMNLLAGGASRMNRNTNALTPP